MPETFCTLAAPSGPGWQQAAGEGVAEEEGLPISLPSKQTLMNLSWAPLSVRGACAVGLGWALGHATGGAPTPASEELAAGGRGTLGLPASPSCCSGHPWAGSADRWADHPSLRPSAPLSQPLRHVFPAELFPGSRYHPSRFHQL